MSTEKKTTLKLIVTLILASGLLYFMTEVGALENTFWQVVNPLSWIPVWVLVNGFMYLALICGLSLIIPRYSISIMILTVFFALLAVVNHYMFRMHGSLFTLVDIYNIGTAANVIGGYEFRIDKYIVMIVFVMILLFVLSIRLFKHKEVDRTHTKKRILCNALLCVVPFLTIYFIPNTPMNELKDDWVWRWDTFYAQYGYLPPFTANVFKGLGKVSQPEDYSTEVLTALPSVDNSNTIDPEDYPDIIIILNESWYDLNQLADINSSEDAFAYYSSMDNAILGKAVISGYAGGTNNSEFELLTSNSVNLLSEGTPFYSLDMTDKHSIVDYLESLGYETAAGHPALSANYHRSTVWPMLGFDYMYFEQMFKPLEIFHGHCRDDYAMKVFLDYMDSDMDKSKPHFGFLLTIQNHGGWVHLDDEEMTVQINPPYEYSEYIIHCIREYISCIEETDKAIEYLTERLTEQYEQTGHKVIVCMVGDHAPSLIMDLETDLYGVKKSVAEHTTPYFIWANYPIDTTAVNNTDLVDICDLVPLVLKTANMPLSVYYDHIVNMVNDGVSSQTDIFSNDKEGISSYQDENDTTVYRTGDAYLDEKGEIRYKTDGTALSELVNLYYCLEYNNLDKKTRMDELFFPQ